MESRETQRQYQYRGFPYYGHFKYALSHYHLNDVSSLEMGHFCNNRISNNTQYIAVLTRLLFQCFPVFHSDHHYNGSLFTWKSDLIPKSWTFFSPCGPSESFRKKSWLIATQSLPPLFSAVAQKLKILYSPRLSRDLTAKDVSCVSYNKCLIILQWSCQGLAEVGSPEVIL